jgi:hypothetical protein
VKESPVRGSEPSEPRTGPIPFFFLPVVALYIRISSSNQIINAGQMKETTETDKNYMLGLSKYYLVVSHAISFLRASVGTPKVSNKVSACFRAWSLAPI